MAVKNLRGNKALGIAIIFAAVCMLAVALLEDFRTSISESHFEEYAVYEDAVDINTASKEELTTLDGIGDAIAERIIKYREETRKFETPEDLMNIRGIGEKVLEKNKGKIITK